MLFRQSVQNNYYVAKNFVNYEVVSTLCTLSQRSLGKLIVDYDVVEPTRWRVTKRTSNDKQRQFVYAPGVPNASRSRFPSGLKYATVLTTSTQQLHEQSLALDGQDAVAFWVDETVLVAGSIAKNSQQTDGRTWMILRNDSGLSLALGTVYGSRKFEPAAAGTIVEATGVPVSNLPQQFPGVPAK